MIARSILVADDDRLLRESLCEALSDLGHRTLDANCGQRAIAIIEGNRQLDLLLSDVDMPDMTGFALIDWLHAHRLAPAVVLMSARADAQLDRAAHDAGAVCLLSKPVGVGRIAGLVAQLFPRG